MYQIITEDTHRSRIVRILNRLFPDGYTVFRAIGYWRGHREQSLVIELCGVKARAARTAAKQIKQANHQQAVLLVSIPNRFVFVGG